MTYVAAFLIAAFIAVFEMFFLVATCIDLDRARKELAEEKQRGYLVATRDVREQYWATLKQLHADLEDALRRYIKNPFDPDALEDLDLTLKDLEELTRER